MTFLPTGGIYVTGGIAPKNLDWILGEDSCFMQAYREKGRASFILEDIPLFLVLVEDMGIRGAAKRAELVGQKTENRVCCCCCCCCCFDTARVAKSQHVATSFILQEYRKYSQDKKRECIMQRK
jgi:hypothetical protein